MASMVLFHSVYGLRPAVHRAADRFRAEGHRVVTPDLYAAEPVDALEAGFALAEATGWPAMLARARAALHDLPAETVLAGFSMGTAVVDALLAERPLCAGVLLLAGAGGDVSHVRPGLRAQLHVADPDEEFAPAGDVHRWVDGMSAAGAVFEVFRYPGVGHLWVDEDIPDHDAPAAERTWQRWSEFLRLS